MSTGIGDVLRSARREHGHSLADAAEHTRIRESYLAALEQEEFDALGGEVYVKGFLVSYAKFLGVDPAPMLHAYRHREGSAAAAAHGEHRGTQLRMRPSPGAVVIVGLLVVLMVVLVSLGLGVGGST